MPSRIYLTGISCKNETRRFHWYSIATHVFQYSNFLLYRHSNICFQTFRRRSHNHAMGCAEGITYSCPCGKNYRKKKDLNKHVKECGRRYSCTSEGCAKTYASEKALRLHIRTVHEGTKYTKKQATCQQCGQQFQGTSNLKRHMKLVHRVQCKSTLFHLLFYRVMFVALFVYI